DDGLHDFDSGQLVARRYVDLRYSAQAYELTVPLPDNLDNAHALREVFEKEHDRTYGYRSSEDPVDIINLRLSVEVKLTPMSMDVMRSAMNSVAEVENFQDSARDAYFGPRIGLMKAKIVSRSELS